MGYEANIKNTNNISRSPSLLDIDIAEYGTWSQNYGYGMSNGMESTSSTNGFGSGGNGAFEDIANGSDNLIDETVKRHEHGDGETLKFERVQNNSGFFIFCNKNI